MASHFLAGKQIVVAGGGMAGLAFAIALRKQWPPGQEPPAITIFERDTEAAAAGREGYSLSLAGFDGTGGLVALKDLGLLDVALGHAVLGLDGSGCFKIWDADWAELMSVRLKPAAGLPTAGIRIARKNLRRTLIDAAVGDQPDAIRWGVACTAAERLEGGRVRVRLADESTVDCDFLVVADGANSKLRASIRPGDTLQHAGAIQIGGNGLFPGGIPKPVDDNWGLQLSGQGVCCFFSPVDDKTVVWALSIREAEGRPPLDRGSPEKVQALMDEALQLGHMFGEPFKTIIEATDPSTALCIPARDRQPFAHDADGGSVVFIGDSNHAVSPFAGYGANLALKDGWDLATKLCGSSSLAEAVAAYDSVSVPRAAKVLKSSRWRIDMGHSTGLKFRFFRLFVTFGGFMLWLVGKS